MRWRHRLLEGPRAPLECLLGAGGHFGMWSGSLGDVTRLQPWRVNPADAEPPLARPGGGAGRAGTPPGPLWLSRR